MTVSIAPAALDELRRLAAAAYPEEGCGVLVGRESAIVEVTSGRNLRTDRAGDRYELDPADIVGAERAARERGLDVEGFWHSHPDHPARPSAFDSERAWPDYVYLICATAPSGALDVRAHRLDEATGRLVEVALTVDAGAARTAP